MLPILAALFGCAGAGGDAPIGPDPAGGEIEAVGAPETLDLGTWNLEWLGDPGNGPANEALQQENVAAVLASVELDLVGVQEVVSEAAFSGVVDRLAGYAGLLADDPRVERGAEYYSDFGGNEQKVGVIYRDTLATVISAQVILVEHDYEFAGRPPLEVLFELSGERELYVIVLHAKAGATEEDHARRTAAAAALKAYLDERPTRAVAVLGDFNDDMDTSIVEGLESPYRPFLDDMESYRIPTSALSVARHATTVNYPDAIDHHLITDELWSAYLEGSAQTVRPEGAIEGYGETTSDHYPVVTRYRR